MSYSGNVHEITFEEKQIILIGTAHISQSSVDEVDSIINQEKPDTVCIELCSCLLYTSPSPRDATLSRMPSSA